MLFAIKFITLTVALFCLTLYISAMIASTKIMNDQHAKTNAKFRLWVGLIMSISFSLWITIILN